MRAEVVWWALQAIRLALGAAIVVIATRALREMRKP